MRKGLWEAYLRKCFLSKHVPNRPEQTIKRANNTDQKCRASGSSRKVPGGICSNVARNPSFSRLKWRTSHRHKRDRYLAPAVVVAVVVVVVVVVVPILLQEQKQRHGRSRTRKTTLLFWRIRLRLAYIHSDHDNSSRVPVHTIRKHACWTG